MLSRRIAVLAGLFLPLAGAAGCSLINAYDAVKESPGDDATTDDGPGDDATTDGTMAAETGSSGGGSSSDATGAGEGSADAMATNPPEAAVDAGAPAGAIVIGGHTVNPTTNVLEVLDPATGESRNQATMSVAGVAYDPDTDLWYIFDTGIVNSMFATPGVPVTLHVRQLDTRPGGTWAWTELSAFHVPPIFSGQQIAVLANRLAYVSFAPADSGALTQLTVIDTTNLGTAMADASDTPITSTLLSGFPNGPTGITGAPPVGGAGGTLALLQNTAIADAGTFGLTTATVNAGGTTIDGTNLLGPTGTAPNQTVTASCGTAVPGAVVQDYGFLYAAPSFGTTGAVNGAVLTDFTIGSMGTLSVGGSYPSVPFQGNGSRLNPIAFASCADFQFAIVSEGLVPALATNYLFVVPVGSPPPDGGFPGFAIEQVTSVSGVIFEPYTSTIVAIGSSSQAQFILGLALTSSGGPPMITPRTGQAWMPPTNLVASWLAVRQPASFQCH
jgi:hypothetical protein